MKNKGIKVKDVVNVTYVNKTDCNGIQVLKRFWKKVTLNKVVVDSILAGGIAVSTPNTGMGMGFRKFLTWDSILSLEVVYSDGVVASAEGMARHIAKLLGIGVNYTYNQVDDSWSHLFDTDGDDSWKHFFDTDGDDSWGHLFDTDGDVPQECRNCQYGGCGGCLVSDSKKSEEEWKNISEDFDKSSEGTRKGLEEITGVKFSENPFTDDELLSISSCLLAIYKKVLATGSYDASNLDREKLSIFVSSLDSITCSVGDLIELVTCQFPVRSEARDLGALHLLMDYVVGKMPYLSEIRCYFSKSKLVSVEFKEAFAFARLFE